MTKLTQEEERTQPETVKSSNVERPARQTQRWVKRLITASALSVVTMMTMGVMVGPASAYTTPSSSGSPGSVQTPFTYGTYNDYYSGKSTSGTVTVPGRNAMESPRYSTYAQWVCVQMNLMISSNGNWWTTDQSASSCGWIPAASTSINLSGYEFPAMGMGSFIYSVNIVVTWKLSNNALIASRTFDYNATGDYRCTTSNTSRCFVGMTTWGGGAFIRFGF